MSSESSGSYSFNILLVEDNPGDARLSQEALTSIWQDPEFLVENCKTTCLSQKNTTFSILKINFKQIR
jgi:hypothetical protein